MTRHSPARFVLAVFLAGLLTACGGATGIDEAGDAATASAGQEAVDPAESDDTDSATPDPDDDGDDEARPGGPEPEEAEGARPGGPFDVEAFEQLGQPIEEFREFGEEYCSGGRCTLVEDTVEDSTVTYCGIDRFSYDPPARPEGASPSDQFIQRGTTVTVHVTCPPEDGGTEEGTAEEETTEEEAEEETSEEEVTEEEVPEEEVPEEETTEDETTEEEPAA